MPRLPSPPRALLAFALALLAALAHARDETVRAGDAAFARELEHRGHTLALRHAGVLRWKLFFRPYAMALYLPEDAAPERWRDAIPKCLVIEYFRDIGGDRFAPAGEAVLERTFEPETLGALREPLDRLAEAYVDIEAGDRYTLCYAPGSGTTLAHNARELVTVGGGSRFAEVYFSIWLGPEPVSAALRDELLGAD